MFCDVTRLQEIEASHSKQTLEDGPSNICLRPDQLLDDKVIAAFMHRLHERELHTSTQPIKLRLIMR